MFVSQKLIDILCRKYCCDSAREEIEKGAKINAMGGH